jgi:hypothetical protein
MKGTARAPDNDWFGGQGQQQALFKLMRQYNLSGKQVAKLLDIDPRTVRRWLAADDQPAHRRMLHLAWYTLLSRAGS